MVLTKKQDFDHPSSADDQRYLPRWEVNNRVLYSFDESPALHEGYTRDLSCAGACLRLNALDSGMPQTIKMKVYLSDTEAVKLEGYVRWVKTVKDALDVGVSFFNTPPLAQEKLLEHAFEVRLEDLEKYWFRGWKK